MMGIEYCIDWVGKVCRVLELKELYQGETEDYKYKYKYMLYFTPLFVDAHSF